MKKHPTNRKKKKESKQLEKPNQGKGEERDRENSSALSQTSFTLE